MNGMIKETNENQKLSCLQCIIERCYKIKNYKLEIHYSLLLTSFLQ